MDIHWHRILETSSHLQLLSNFCKLISTINFYNSWCHLIPMKMKTRTKIRTLTSHLHMPPTPPLSNLKKHKYEWKSHSDKLYTLLFHCWDHTMEIQENQWLGLTMNVNTKELQHITKRKYRVDIPQEGIERCITNNHREKKEWDD